MATPANIAPPDSLLGLLQRGRGEGYRRILKVPKSEAPALLVQCITNDPRLDTQVESRDQFYASIATEIDFQLEPLVKHLRNHDDSTQGSSSTCLTVTTLAELAKRDYRDAKDILCDYVRWGQWWNWPIHELVKISDDSLSMRLARSIEQHFSSNDGLDEAMLDCPIESFTELARFSSRIQTSNAKAVAKITSSRRPALPDLSALDTKELLNLVDQNNYRLLGKPLANVVRPTDQDMLVSHVSLDTPFVAHVALAGLARLGPASLFKWLVDFWMTLPERSDPTNKQKNLGRVILRQSILRTLLALPGDVTITLAREWISQKDSRKRELAEKLLQEHATVEDIPILREALRPMLNNEEAEWDCFLLKAFYRLPNIGQVSELIDIFHQFRFSMGRAYAAEAIQVTSPEYFRDNLALECLWDCEEGTRELAAKFVPLWSEEALQRVRRLAQDSLENEEVRAESKKRVDNFSTNL
jgi:hypothetical protein